MKINKKKLIELFRVGLCRLDIRTGTEMCIKKDILDYGQSWSYVIENGNVLFGSIQLYAVKNKFFIKFFVSERVEEGYNSYDYLLNYEHKYGEDKSDFKYEITKEEFAKLSRAYKRKYVTVDKILKRNKQLKKIEVTNITNRKLEILSDEFALDFFPKTRKILTEKLNKDE